VRITYRNLFFAFIFLNVVGMISLPVPLVLSEETSGNQGTIIDASEISEEWNIKFISILPLDENFTVLPLHLNSCTLYPYLRNRLIGCYINSTEALMIYTNVYIGCPNVSGMKVEVLPANITYRDGFFKVVMVPVNIYTDFPFPYGVELRSENVTISYVYHNSTHFFIIIEILNFTVSPEIRDTFGISNPEYFGWPREIIIKFLVNRKTGDAYLIDGDNMVYVGTTPFYLPEFNPKQYLLTVRENTYRFINTIKENPWIIKEIIEKASLANSSWEAHRIISEATINFTEKIMLIANHQYLGLPLKFDGSHITAPIDDINLWRVAPKVKANVSVILSPQIKNLTKDAVLNYLKSGDEKGILEIVNKTLYVKEVYYPFLFTNIFVHVSVPINTSDFLPLPLPKKYGEKLGAKYIFVNLLRNAEKYPYVYYDPRLFTPENLSEGLKNLEAFLPLLYSEIAGHISGMLHSSMLKGEIDYEKLDTLYMTVSDMIDDYLEEVYKEETTSHKEETSKKEDSKKESPKKEDSPSSKSEISNSNFKGLLPACGPGVMLLFILLPLVRRWHRE